MEPNQNDRVRPGRSPAGWILASGAFLLTGFVLGGHWYTAGPGQFGGAIVSAVSAAACLVCFLRSPPGRGPKGTTLLLTALAFIVVALLWPRPMRERDRSAIAEAVRQRTDEPILGIRTETWWSVEVMTGKDGPPNMRNSGHWFELVRTFRGWRIRNHGIWDS